LIDCSTLVADLTVLWWLDEFELYMNEGRVGGRRSEFSLLLLRQLLTTRRIP